MNESKLQQLVDSELARIGDLSDPQKARRALSRALRHVYRLRWALAYARGRLDYHREAQTARNVDLVQAVKSAGAAYMAIERVARALTDPGGAGEFTGDVAAAIRELLDQAGIAEPPESGEDTPT